MLRIGNGSNPKIYVGNQAVKKVYQGSNEVWSAPVVGASDALNLADWGVDTTGNTNNYIEVKAALDQAVAEDRPIEIPAGEILIGRRIIVTVPRGKHLHMFSNGNSRFLQPGIGDGNAANFAIVGEKFLTTTLLADVARKSTTVRLADTTGLEVGDILSFVSRGTPVETGWKYDKRCIRRVAGISGDRVTLDQELEFFFNTSENTDITAIAAASVRVDNLAFTVGKLGSFSLSGLSGQVNNISVLGPTRKWTGPLFSDGFSIARCDQIVVDGGDFKNLRYCPFITAGSRNITIRNFRVEGIRHADANGWAENILFENGVGVDTDGIIQTHPCIRPTFRNVHDTITAGHLYGLDLRGVGEVVENCSANSINATKPGSNTSSPLLKPEYMIMATEKTRIIRNFSSPTAAIKPGKEGRLIIENCTVPYITGSSGHPNSDQVVVVDEATTETYEQIFSSNAQRSLNNITSAAGGAVTIPTSTTYSPNLPARAITSITQGNPGVVTAPGHGVREMQYVYFDRLNGMETLLNKRFRAVNVTADTFEIGSPRDGSPINTSRYPAFAGAGYVIPAAAYLSVTGMTIGSNVTVTVPGHGLGNGQVILLTGLTSPSELRYQYFQIRNATTNTFVLANAATGALISGSGLGAYAGSGIVTPQYSTLTIDANSKANCGFARFTAPMHMQTALTSQLNEARAGSEARIMSKVYDMEGGQMDQRDREGHIKVTLSTAAGTMVVRRGFFIDYVQGGRFELQVTESSTFPAVAEPTLTITRPEVLGRTNASWSNEIWNDPDVNFMTHWTFEIIVTDPSGPLSRFTNCEVEIIQERLPPPS